MARVMKDSGIEWIGEIPANWKTNRGKNILQIVKREYSIEDGVITCFRDGEVTLRTKRREDGFTFSDKEIGYQGIQCGDLVIHGMDGFAGAIGISDSDGKGSPVLIICRAKDNTVLKFSMYYLRMLASQNVFLALATGIRERSCDLRWNKISDLIFPNPSLQEQQKIASYLDYKCSQIDSIIEKQKIVIEKLKQYKQFIITEAVTKGLNPTVKMKPSGIEWIGDIPEGWKINKLKYIAKYKNGLAHEQGMDVQGEYVVVNSKFVSTEGKVRFYCNEQIMPLYKNDVCIVLSDVPNGRAYAKCYIIEKDGTYTLNQRVGCFSAIQMNLDFFYYYLSRSTGLLLFDDGINQTNLRKPDLLNLVFLIPPNAYSGLSGQ